MNILFFFKLLAGLAIVLVTVAVLLLAWVAFFYVKHYLKRKDFNQLKQKNKSLTRQRMETLRQYYQQPPLSKQELLLLRKAKHLRHRQLFFQQIAKRKR